MVFEPIASAGNGNGLSVVQEAIQNCTAAFATLRRGKLRHSLRLSLQNKRPANRLHLRTNVNYSRGRQKRRCNLPWIRNDRRRVCGRRIAEHDGNSRSHIAAGRLQHLSRECRARYCVACLVVRGDGRGSELPSLKIGAFRSHRAGRVLQILFDACHSSWSGMNA